MTQSFKLSETAKYDIWLTQCNEIGIVHAKLLINYFGSSEAIYKADKEQFCTIKGLKPDMVNSLSDKDMNKVMKIIAACNESGVSIITLSDEAYPDRLRNIYDPPLVLYIKGKLPPVDELPVVGIVGTRSCSAYGVKNAELLGKKLSQHNIIVATGLAKGVDTAAARGALCGDAPVIGVIGCGINMVYPPQNRRLFDEVEAHGAIISEYPPDTKTHPAFFPMRNRIISGLSNGVAVIEAPERSGALITAQRALEQCRDIFVLPGNVDAIACVGSNKLLREGAIPFLCADDIIDEYKDLFNNIKKPIDNNPCVDYIDVDVLPDDLSDSAKSVVKLVGQGALYTDEIINKTGLSAQSITAVLTELEINALIKRNNSGKWEITK